MPSESSKPTFIPFESVDGLVPGRSTFANAREIFGTPNRLERRRRSRSCVAHFRRRGVWVILGGDDDAALVDGVYVEDPYSGATPEGLRIGLDEHEAMVSIERAFAITLRLNGSLYLARLDDLERDDFQVWFAAGRLIRMKVLRPIADES